MFEVKDDLTIYCTRGDVALLSVTADENGVNYIFQPGDVVRMKVFEKKDCQCVVMQKDIIIEETTDKVDILLTGQETRICEVISKPKDFWYEVELNPETNPQTIIGYDEDGPKVFKMFPEGKEIEYEPGGDAPFLEELVEKEVTEYLTENPPKDGVDGLPCTHSWNGTILTITSASGTSAADLKGERGETGESGKDGKDGKDATVDYSLVANALKGNASGEVISLDDVSSLEHTVGVKARSKNIIPLPYYNESGYENNGITYTYGADGIIYASGTSTAVSRFYITPYSPYLPISVGTYIISIAGTGIDGKNIQLIGNIRSQSEDEYLEIYYDRSRSLIRNIGNGGKFRFYLYIPSGVTLENAEIRVQLEKGTTPTEYAPYVDVIGTMILVNETEYPVNADGKAQGVKSIAPNMTITSDTGGVMLDVAYNKDTNKVIEKLINRIAALESAVI